GAAAYERAAGGDREPGPAAGSPLGEEPGASGEALGRGERTAATELGRCADRGPGPDTRQPRPAAGVAGEAVGGPLCRAAGENDGAGDGPARQRPGAAGGLDQGAARRQRPDRVAGSVA